jgi:hypothetical protein
VICQLGFTPAATHEANIPKVIATIRLERVDFRFIVRGYHPVPVQPPLPPFGHGIGHINFHNACSVPVMSPPRRRMKTPEILSPPLAQVFGQGTLYFPDQPSARYATRPPGLTNRAR